MKNLVFLTGPHSEQDKYGDEFPTWLLTVAQDSDDPDPKYSYKVFNFERAYHLGEKVARDQRTEFVNEAIQA